MTHVKNGDLQKMSLLFDRYHKRLFGFFWHCNLEMAVCEDLVQTVFYRMIKYRESYNESLSFKTWMFALAKNAVNDEVNRSKKRVLTNEEVGKATTEAGEPDKGIVQKEQKEMLSMALNALPEESRQILLLARFEEMPYREISKMMHISEANVKVRVYRAMRELKEVYLKLDK